MVNVSDQLSIPREHITGIILCGGQGTRMGGVEKGLMSLQEQTLLAHSIARLQSQVEHLLINANRRREDYVTYGYPVVADIIQENIPASVGPLGGILAGLIACTTPYLACIPCDAPCFPNDLVSQLSQSLIANNVTSTYAIAPDASGQERPQPVFCLLKVEGLRESLERYLQSGERKLLKWLQTTPYSTAHFSDAQAFVNLNTLEELQAQQHTVLPKQ